MKKKQSYISKLLENLSHQAIWELVIKPFFVSIGSIITTRIISNQVEIVEWLFDRKDVILKILLVIVVLIINRQIYLHTKWLQRGIKEVKRIL